MREYAIEGVLGRFCKAWQRWVVGFGLACLAVAKWNSDDVTPVGCFAIFSDG